MVGCGFERAQSGSQMKLVASIALPLAVLTLAACGSSTPSKQQAAVYDVCAARADIKNQVATLGNVVAAPGTPQAVATALTAMKDDVNTIRAARADLAAQAAARLAAVSDAFSGQLQSVATRFPRDVAGAPVAVVWAPLSSAREQLATADQRIELPVNC
jgi:uncharacterized lipoprotein